MGTENREQGLGNSGQELATTESSGLLAPPYSLTPDPCALDPLALRAAAFARAAKAPSTLRAYAADWAHFLDWCGAQNRAALPATPETVALYLTALARTHRPATITRRLTAITKAHQARGLASPATVSELAVGETLKGIRRTLGTAQKAKVPLLTADLLQVLAHRPPGLAGVRDRALLLVGYAGAFRRSELATLQLADVTWVDEGAVLTLTRSKTDQEGQGRQVALPRGAHAATCPVQALRTWIHEAQLTEGALFRGVDRHGKLRAGRLHADAVGAIVQRALRRAGFEVEKYGGHSLRAGFATQAAKNGATAFDIMRQTGHRSVQTISRYKRSPDLPRCAGREIRIVIPDQKPFTALKRFASRHRPSLNQSTFTMSHGDHCWA